MNPAVTSCFRTRFGSIPRALSTSFFGLVVPFGTRSAADLAIRRPSPSVYSFAFLPLSGGKESGTGGPSPWQSVTVDWGDGQGPLAGQVTGTNGTGTETNGNGACRGTHTYATDGVYSVKLTVSDTDTPPGVSVPSQFQYIVIYDPTAGWVSGGGWINSPPGAYIPNPSLTGKATFGFVSKYKKGATTPSGNTEFNFKAAKLKFHSDTYQWLVVAGAKAQYKGTGTLKYHTVAHTGDTDCDIEGHFTALSGPFGFMLTAQDSSVSSNLSSDTFRIKIWQISSDGTDGATVYDNGTDQYIGGGKITIHSN